VADLQDTVLDIHVEGKLQNEIKDIIEELDIMLFISKRQGDVLEEFIRNAKTILKGVPNEESKSNTPSASRESSGLADSANTPADPKGKGKATADRAPISRQEKLRWFEGNAKDLVRKVRRHVDELALLKRSAECTSASVRHTWPTVIYHANKADLGVNS